jgi:hypothetical protein
VNASGKRWRATICYGGKQHYLGNVATKQEAALAYDRAARQCGEERPLNYESIEAAEEAAAEAQAEIDVRRRVDCRLVAAEATASIGLLAVVVVAIGAGGAASAVVVALVTVAVVVAAAVASVVAAVAVAVAAAVVAAVVAARGTAPAPSTPSRRPHSPTTGQHGNARRRSCRTSTASR